MIELNVGNKKFKDMTYIVDGKLIGFSSLRHVIFHMEPGAKLKIQRIK